MATVRRYRTTQGELWEVRYRQPNGITSRKRGFGMVLQNGHIMSAMSRAFHLIASRRRSCSLAVRFGHGPACRGK